MSAEDRKAMRQKQSAPVWKQFWQWLETFEPAGGSALDKVVTYAKNHHDTLMNYLEDGRCEASNN